MCYIPLLSVVCLFCIQPKKQMRNLHQKYGVVWSVKCYSLFFFYLQTAIQQIHSLT